MWRRLAGVAVIRGVGDVGGDSVEQALQAELEAGVTRELGAGREDLRRDHVCPWSAGWGGARGSGGPGGEAGPGGLALDEAADVVIDRTENVGCGLLAKADALEGAHGGHDEAPGLRAGHRVDADLGVPGVPAQGGADGPGDHG